MCFVRRWWTVHDCTHIVTVDNCRKRDVDVELLEQLMQPTTLGHNMCHCTVFDFGTGARYHHLTLGGPRHHVTEVDAEAGGGAVRVGAASPVSVGVGSELINSAGAQLQTC